MTCMQALSGGFSRASPGAGADSAGANAECRRAGSAVAQPPLGTPGHKCASDTAPPVCTFIPACVPVLTWAASRESSSPSVQARGTAGHGPSYRWRQLSSSASAWRPALRHHPAGCIPWNCGCTNSQFCAPRRSRPTATRRLRPQLTQNRRPRPQLPSWTLTALAAARSGRFLGAEHTAARCSGYTPCELGDSPAP